MRCGPRTEANCTLVRSGNSSCVSSNGPSRWASSDRELLDVYDTVGVTDRHSGEAKGFTVNLDPLANDVAARSGDRDPLTLEARLAHFDKDHLSRIADLALDGASPGYDRENIATDPTLVP